MIVVSAIIQAKPGKEKEVEEALKAVFPEVRGETGTLTYILHRSASNPGKFVFYETYRDKEALDYHASTTYFKASFARVKELAAEPPVIELLEQIDAIQR